MRTKAGITIHLGKTKLWNAEGRQPGVVDAFKGLVWRGDFSLPPSKQGLKILGVPIGHPEYIVRELAQKVEEQSLLLERIPLIQDVQAAWLLFGALFLESSHYAEVHDRSVTSCLEQIFQKHDIHQHIWESVSMPLTLGGLVCGASRTCDAVRTLGRIALRW